ncbi:hypothetical protein AALO_G00199590 [Alosa alosa]|uniref:Mitochondrial fission factor n=2 Tax=Alosa TaxID=34772 RepID=A0AAV6G2C9_9TELE|nr:mitochondrial fission factor homolog B isoform X1 [Alosa sapidissima]XP_048120669.1 mitochondrial fission factor homolog B isoform X1 [Alosa alosa]KAG5269218.1 hypothetical protein AALO_G00199590 [Alosa alosa]
MALSRSSSEMNGAAFPSPTAEMAEINRIHYDLEYTEGISQQMRVPEMLKYSTDDQEKGFFDAPHSVMMHVPERIVVAGDGDDSQFPRPRDLDLIQSTPLEGVALKTPPRVLTLNERPLDFLEMERSSAPSQPTEEVRSHGRLRRERSASENTATRQNGQLPLNDSIVTPSLPAPVRAVVPLGAPVEEGEWLSSPGGLLSFLQSSTRRAYQHVLEVLDENQRSKPVLRGGSSSSSSNPGPDSRCTLTTMDTTLEGGPDDMAVVDATTLRRQIIKLNRRLQLLEDENKERVKREKIMYSITVAFWLINTWVWFRR